MSKRVRVSQPGSYNHTTDSNESSLSVIIADGRFPANTLVNTAAGYQIPLATASSPDKMICPNNLYVVLNYFSLSTIPNVKVEAFLKNGTNPQTFIGELNVASLSETTHIGVLKIDFPEGNLVSILGGNLFLKFTSENVVIDAGIYMEYHIEGEYIEIQAQSNYVATPPEEEVVGPGVGTK